MKINVVYASKTGNTKLVAEAIKEVLKNFDIEIYSTTEGVRDGDIYFIGSWTDKGNETKDIMEFIKSLKNKKIAIFGTAGFGGSETYFQTLASRAYSNLDESNNKLGYFYCQGKMPLSVRERYVKLIQENPEDKKLLVSVKNFDEALSHPNSLDLINAQKRALNLVNNLVNHG